MATTNDYFNELINSLKDSCLSDMNVLYIAKIKEIKPPTAVVQPLAMIDHAKQSEVHRVHFLVNPLINNTPKDINTGEWKLDYKKGDNVIVGCFDTDNALFNNKSFYISSDIRKHSIDYSVILGRYARSSDFK